MPEQHEDPDDTVRRIAGLPPYAAISGVLACGECRMPLGTRHSDTCSGRHYEEWVGGEATRLKAGPPDELVEQLARALWRTAPDVAEGDPGWSANDGQTAAVLWRRDARQCLDAIEAAGLRLVPADQPAPTLPPDLAAIRARVDAATDGPWLLEPGSRSIANAAGQRIVASVGASGSWPSPADAEFIAHAREDVPTLLRLLRAAQIDQGVFDSVVELGRANRRRAERAEADLARAEQQADDRG